MRKNKLREKIRKGEPTLATRMLSPWAGMAEIIGYTGLFDYIEFLGEYTSWTLHDLENIARAIELFDMSSMIKIDQNNRAFIAQRALGAGIQNVLFTDIRTYEDVIECVKIVKAETPERKGLNGAASRRNTGYFIESGHPSYVEAMDDVVIAIMIEKREAVEHLDEILSVKGIDMVQFGPNDYSMSIGHPGERNHPKVKEAEAKTIKLAIEKGIRPRVEFGVNYTEEDIKKYMDLGVKDFSLPNEGRIVYDWLKKNGTIFKKIIG